ncbi:MAG: MFS transporter [Candidatus Eremiobacteraeota bacterium]|nr:MFS transporter [Candidatus Eremiobacteraeota bacterium]
MAAVAPRYRILAVMTAAQIGTTVVQQGFGSLAPAIVAFYHVNKAQLGVAFTALNVGAALTVAVAGLVVDRLGERAVTVFSGIAVGLTLIVGALVPSYAWLVTWLLLTGVAYSAMTPAGGRAILAWFDRDRGFAMSVRQMGVSAGAVIGGIVLPALALRWDYQAALIGGGIIAIVVTSGAMLFYVEPPLKARSPTRTRTLLLGMRAIAADPRTITYTSACMILCAAQQIMNGFISLTATSQGGATLALAAVVFSSAQMAAVVGRPAWGWVSDAAFRGDRSLPIAVISVLVLVASLGLAATTPSNLGLLFASALLMGLTAAGWNGLFATAMAEIGGIRFAGSAIGLGLTAIFLAGAIGPSLFGVLADAHGLRVAWIALGFTALVAVLPALLSHRAFADAEAAPAAKPGGTRPAGA